MGQLGEVYIAMGAGPGGEFHFPVLMDDQSRREVRGWGLHYGFGSDRGKVR